MKRFLIFGFLFIAAALVLYSCQKELSVETNTNTASFSLHDDSTLLCNPITVNGTYYNGVSAVADTNYITVVVNIKKTGNYAIASSSTNGFSFRDSGFFSKTGTDTLILKAIGTPILIKSTEFTIAGNDSLGACNFFIDVQDSTGTGLGGGDTTVIIAPIDTSYTDPNPATDSSWHFTDSANGDVNDGTMGIAGNSFIDSSGIRILTLAGLSTDSTETFGFRIYTSKSQITTGVYPITGQTSLGLLDNTDQSIIYVSNEALITGASSYSYINIKSYDATTKHIQGVFHCWAIDGSTGELVLLKGSFNTYLP